MMFRTLFLAASFAAMAGIAQAQTGGHDHNHGAKTPAQGSAPLATGVDGEVRRVDRDNARLSIRHGEIKAIDMPPMTMVFHVRDAALLDGVKVGDKVRFSISREDGKLIATELQVQR